MKKVTKELIFLLVLSVIYINGNNAHLKQQGSVALTINTFNNIKNQNFTEITMKNQKSNEVGQLWSKLSHESDANMKNKKDEKSIVEVTRKLKEKISDKITKKISTVEAKDETPKDLVQQKNYWQEFILSFSLNFFSEIGDKSFVSIILVYDQISPLLLFLVASVSEIFMNLFSVGIGYQLRAHPGIKIFCQFAGMITAVIFSICLIYEIFSGEEEEEKNQSDIEKQTDIAEREINSNSKKSGWTGILKVANIAWIIFLSELGDKSQITTIILSTEYNPLPIFLGTALAHVLGILLSMTIGYIVAHNTNKTILTCLGAICFLYFGLEMGHEFLASGGFKTLLEYVSPYSMKI
jgi:Ca2+/H+ antiporter, TMEM165/GDT1 family